MKRRFIFLAAAAIAAMFASCNNDSLSVSEPSDEIVFRVGGAAASAEVQTKATAVNGTNLNNNGFLVNCVNGTAGADVQVWSNVRFTKDGSVWKANKWWPLTNNSYRFYGVYSLDLAEESPTLSMTYAAGGPTISASAAYDILSAYLEAPTYKSPNTLVFDHIFARVKNMTVTAIDGYTISGVTINITPKVSGTYNLYTGHGQTDGTGWSSTATGSAVNLANATPGTKTNDVYLVPGTYTLSASWTATKDNYTETFTDMTVDVALVAGKTNNISVNLTGNGTEIVFDVSVTDWSDNAVNGGTFPVVDVEAYTLPGVFSVSSTETVRFSKGNLWAHVASGPTDDYNYAADEWGFHMNQWDWCNQSLEVGHTVDHFCWVGESASYDSYGLCTKNSLENEYYGTSASDVLKTDWGDIPGVIASCGDGWRTLSNAEWGHIFNSRTTGGSVDGTADVRYTQATIRTDVSGVKGIILFPDGVIFTADEFTTVGTLNAASDWTTNCTAVQWTALEAKGCVFLPASGQRTVSSPFYANLKGGYWSSSPSTASRSRRVYIYTNSFIPMDNETRFTGLAVRLVR